MFGAVTLAATASWSIWVIIRFVQIVIQGGERRAWLGAVRRHLSSLIGFGMLLFAALAHGAGLGRGLQLAGGVDAGAAVLGDDRVVGAADPVRQAQAGLTAAT